MNAEIAIILIGIIIMLGMIAVIAVASYAMYNYFNQKREELKFQMEVMMNKPPDRTKNLQYSKDCLDFIRMIVGQESVLLFKDFTDSHHIEKVTLSQVKKIVADVANQVNNSIKRANIDFETTIFNEQFYNHYVIECSKDFVKRLLNQYMIEIVEE